MRAVVGVVGLSVLSGCAEAGPAGRQVEWADPFCAEVQPRVDAFLESVRTERSAPSDDRYGGTAVVASVAELTGGLSPVTGVTYLGRQYQNFALLTTLVSYDEELQPAPYLARSWDVSGDSTTLTFHLRGDVRWHDGTPTTAHDVVYTYRVVTDPTSGFPNPAYWYGYDTGADGISAVDDTTVVVRLGRRADVLDPWTSTAILPRHLLGDVPPDGHAEHPYATVCPVGNGPFVFVSHEAGDRWTFEANPAFPNELGGRPYLDRVVYRVIPEPSTMLSELLTGGIDVYERVLPDHADRIRAAPGLDLRAYRGTEVAFVAWNGRRPQLADARVRRALTMAVDRQEIVDAIVGGLGAVAHSGVPPVHWAYEPEGRHALPFDPQGARALLGQAGWIDRDGDGVRESERGERLSITLKYNRGSTQRQQIAEILQARLAEVGVEAVPTVLEANTLGAQVFDPSVRDFDGFIISWTQDFRLDESDFFHSGKIGGPWALSGTRNAHIDRLLDTLQVVSDREAALPLWREYQRSIAREQPFTYLYFGDKLMGTSARLRGAVMDARGELVSLREWWLDPDGR